MESEFIVKLRAHHLLCLQGYQGFGYDERFKVNLEKTLNRLKNKDSKVVLTSLPDDICKKCPNMRKQICIGNSDTISKSLENNDKIVKKDLAILKKIKIEINKEYVFKDLIQIVNNVFIKKYDLNDICKDCQWTNECLWYQSRET